MVLGPLRRPWHNKFVCCLANFDKIKEGNCKKGFRAAQLTKAQSLHHVKVTKSQKRATQIETQ